MLYCDSIARAAVSLYWQRTYMRLNKKNFVFVWHETIFENSKDCTGQCR